MHGARRVPPVYSTDWFTQADNRGLKSRAWLKTTNGLVTDDNPSQFQKHAAYLINSCRRTHSAVFGGSNDYSLLVSSMQNFKNVTAVRVFFFLVEPLFQLKILLLIQ